MNTAMVVNRVRPVAHAAGRAARRAAPHIARTARAVWAASRAVAVFLFAWAPRGLAVVVGGWARLIPSRFPIWAMFKAGLSLFLIVVTLFVLFGIWGTITAAIREVIDPLYLQDFGLTAKVGLAVAAAMWVGVWSVFGIIGRPAAQGVPGEKTDGLTKEQTKIAAALTATIPAVRAATKAMQPGDPPVIRLSRLERTYGPDGQSTGRQTTIQLPFGATSTDVKPHVIAQALGNTARDQVTVTEGRDPGQAIVFVADKSPSKIGPPPWPLTGASSFDLTRPIPIGQAIDGTPAGLQLFSRDARGNLQGFHLLLAGMSRYGKSSLLQLILSAAALDPKAVINVAVPQDTLDFDDLEPALSFLAVDATIEDVRGMLARAVAHMSARAGVPYIVVLDEAQLVLGEKGDREARELTHELLSAGGKAGIAVILVTQEPTGRSLAPDLARRPQNRISFRQSQNESAQRAMGVGMTDDTDPSKFPGGSKGLAAVIGEDGFHGKVKTPLIPESVVKKIAKAHPRVKLNTAPAAPPAGFPAYPGPGGQSGVQDPAEPPEPFARPEPAAPATIVDHLRMVWPDDQDRASTAGMLMMLLSIDPVRYAGWEPKDVTPALKAAGWAPRGDGSVRIGGKSQRGAYRSDVMAVRGGCDVAP